MSLKTWREDILTSYNCLWSFSQQIPTLESVLESIIEEKKGELIVDLLSYYKNNNMLDDYERIERGEILDVDFEEIGFSFTSLKSDIEDIFKKEGVVFVKDNKIINSSKQLLFENWEENK